MSTSREDITMCDFCNETRSFDPLSMCGCAYSGLFRCAERAVCGDCARAHAKLGLFFTGLMNSRQPRRSNAARSKLFRILSAAVEGFGLFPNRRDVLALLASTSVFDPNFSTIIRNVASKIPANDRFAAEVQRQLLLIGAARTMERANELIGRAQTQEARHSWSCAF
jgi:hypothetical protein